MAQANNYNDALDALPLSVFDDLERRVAARKHPRFLKLHQGKTTFDPCARMSDWTHGDFDLRAHEHSPPGGIPGFRKKLVRHLAERGRLATDSNLIITCGSTHGLGSVLRALLEPGDEVLVLSPQWLFTCGLVHAAGGLPIEVPVFLELSRDPDFDFVAALEAHVTPRTRAVYFNTPNNPTGHSLTKGSIARLAEFAERQGLWILSDNAYEIYDFSPGGFIDIAQEPAAKDRTFSIHSFSKTYAMPGYRLGYMLVPERMAARLRKWGLYSIYSMPTASQFAGYLALDTPPERLDRHRAQTVIARDMVAADLAVPHTKVDGGFYTFLDLSASPGGVEAFLARAIEEGVSVAPGVAFGRHCRDWARVCFSAVNHDGLRVGIERLNRVYGSAS